MFRRILRPSCTKVFIEIKKCNNHRHQLLKLNSRFMSSGTPPITTKMHCLSCGGVLTLDTDSILSSGNDLRQRFYCQHCKKMFQSTKPIDPFVEDLATADFGQPLLMASSALATPFPRALAKETHNNAEWLKRTIPQRTSSSHPPPCLPPPPLPPPLLPLPHHRSRRGVRPQARRFSRRCCARLSACTRWLHWWCAASPGTPPP